MLLTHALQNEKGIARLRAVFARVALLILCKQATSYTPAQREKISSFVAFTGRRQASLAFSLTLPSENTAVHLLQAHQWNLERTLDSFFSDPPEEEEEEALPYDLSKIEALYTNYKSSDASKDCIDEDGMMRLIGDLTLDDVGSLVLGWLCAAKTSGEISKAQFVDGLTRLQADSLEKLKASIQQARNEFAQQNRFADFYAFTFDLALQPGSRTLPLDTATLLWQMLLPHFDMLKTWLDYVNKHRTNAVSRDMWCQLLEFFVDAPDLNAHDPDDSTYPIAIDEFIEWIVDGKPDA